MTMCARRPQVDRQAHLPPPHEPPQTKLPSLLLASPSSSSSTSKSSPCSFPLRPTPSSPLRIHNSPSPSLLPSTAILVLVLLQLAWGVHHAGASSHLPRAAVLYDPNLIDTSDDGSGEGYNVLQTLSSWGYHYTTIETNVLADWRAALDDAQMLIFPEPGESGRPRSNDPLDYLGLGVINQVRMFVAVGGLFVQLGDNLTVVPYVFNLDWTPGGSSQDPSVPTPARASTVFASCAYSLAGIDLVYHYNVSVNSSVCLQYKAGTNNGCTLMRTTYGQGVVTWIGYDWYQARPVGTQDSGWVQVFQRALSEAPEPSPSPSASPSASETPSRTPSQSPSQSSSPTASITPSQSPSAPPSITPSPTSSRSQTPSSTPPPSITPSPSVTPSMTPSGSPSASATPSPTRSPTPSRTPSKSVTPSGSPAPATGNYPDTDTSLHFFSHGPNVQMVEESSNRSVVLKFVEVTLRDANNAPFSSLLLPTSDYEVSASGREEVEATGVETFGFATTLNSVPMVFNFTHPLVNDTLMSFANMAFVVERGAVKWLWAFDGAWPFDPRASGFTLTASLEFEAARVTGVERLNNHPRPGRTTYSVNHNRNDNENRKDGKSLEVKFVVFDRAVADGEFVDVVHGVELVTDGGAQVAHFHFTFPAFSYTFLYDPELVLVVHQSDSGGGSASPGGLIAGIVALAFIGGLVGLAVVRSALSTPPADEAYRGLDNNHHVLIPTDDIEESPPPLTKGRRPSYDGGTSVGGAGGAAAEGSASGKRSVAGGSGGNNHYLYDYEEEDDNFYRGEGDFEMEVLSRPTPTAKKPARATRFQAPSQSSNNNVAKASSKTVRDDDDGTYDSEFNGHQTRSGGRAAGVRPTRPRAPTEYQWEGTDDDRTTFSQYLS